MNFFDKLFPKDKKCFEKVKMPSDLYEEPEVYIFDVKEEPEPMKAVIYLNFSSYRIAERFMEREKMRGQLYCKVQQYETVVMLKSVSELLFMRMLAMDRIREMARTGQVDVIVLPTINGLCDDMEEMLDFLDEMYQQDIKVEWIGHGELNQKIFEAYMEELERQELEFERFLKNCAKKMDDKERD